MGIGIHGLRLHPNDQIGHKIEDKISTQGIIVALQTAAASIQKKSVMTTAFNNIISQGSISLTRKDKPLLEAEQKAAENPGTFQTYAISKGTAIVFFDDTGEHATFHHIPLDKKDFNKLEPYLNAGIESIDTFIKTKLPGLYSGSNEGQVSKEVTTVVMALKDSATALTKDLKSAKVPVLNLSAHDPKITTDILTAALLDKNVKPNPTVTSLNLSGQKLTLFPDDLVALIDAKFPNLKTLDLSQNLTMDDRSLALLNKNYSASYNKLRLNDIKLISDSPVVAILDKIYNLSSTSTTLDLTNIPEYNQDQLEAALSAAPPNTLSNATSLTINPPDREIEAMKSLFVKFRVLRRLTVCPPLADDTAYDLQAAFNDLDIQSDGRVILTSFKTQIASIAKGNCQDLYFSGQKLLTSLVNHLPMNRLLRLSEYDDKKIPNTKHRFKSMFKDLIQRDLPKDMSSLSKLVDIGENLNLSFDQYPAIQERFSELVTTLTPLNLDTLLDLASLGERLSINFSQHHPIHERFSELVTALTPLNIATLARVVSLGERLAINVSQHHPIHERFSELVTALHSPSLDTVLDLASLGERLSINFNQYPAIQDQFSELVTALHSPSLDTVKKMSYLGLYLNDETCKSALKLFVIKDRHNLWEEAHSGGFERHYQQLALAELPSIKSRLRPEDQPILSLLESVLTRKSGYPRAALLSSGEDNHATVIMFEEQQGACVISVLNRGFGILNHSQDGLRPHKRSLAFQRRLSLKEASRFEDLHIELDLGIDNAYKFLAEHGDVLSIDEMSAYQLPYVSPQKTGNCYAMWFENVIRWCCWRHHHPLGRNVNYSAEASYTRIRIAQLQLDMASLPGHLAQLKSDQSPLSQHLNLLQQESRTDLNKIQAKIDRRHRKLYPNSGGFRFSRHSEV